MTTAEEILSKYPSVKLGLDDHYGKQTVLNALNEALRIQDVVGLREQLFSFLEWLDQSPEENSGRSREDLIKDYLLK